GQDQSSGIRPQQFIRQRVERRGRPLSELHLSELSPQQPTFSRRHSVDGKIPTLESVALKDGTDEPFEELSIKINNEEGDEDRNRDSEEDKARSK
ncbi:hypothetical protein DFQ29_001316, partial [Apophysomyces sp. BC1021]